MKDKIVEMLEGIIPSEFTLEIDDDGYASFKKEETDRLMAVGLGSILKGTFRGIGGSVSFFHVEKILRPSFIKDKDYNYSTTITTKEHCFLRGISRNEFIYSNLPLTIDSDAALEKARVLIRQFIEQDALPFFSYWSDIRKFLPYLETEDIVVVANDVFYNEGMKKKLIVWWLCGHPNFEKFKRERLAVYEDEMQTLDAYDHRSYKSLLTTIKRLEKEKPLYAWDSSWLEQR